MERINEYLVMARINRMLAKEQKTLHKCRKADKLLVACVTYWVRDDRKVSGTHIDLKKVGRELASFIAE